MELSGFKLNKESISEHQYQNLEYGKGSNYQQKNWVDFYDCLMLNWFFYLRAKDIPAIKSDWFTDKGLVEGQGQVRLFLEEIKAGRKQKYETAHYRPKAYDFWKGLNKRKPRGYLGMPYYERKNGEENLSNVGQTINDMLKEVVSLCKIKKRRKVVWTIIRHTSFRLTLEDIPELSSNPMELNTFAKNGHTTVEMLYKHYLYSIESERTALRAQKKIKTHSWELLKRVGDSE